MEYIISKLKKINNDYLDILKKFKNKVNDKKDLKILLHTLGCFWESNKQTALFCIDSLRLNKDKVTIYTGACDLGYEFGEHCSFLLSNKFKIYDDPILKYLLVISNWEQQADLYLKKALYSLNEDISLLEENFNDFFIVPLSYFYKDKSLNFLKEIENDIFKFVFDYKLQSAEEILKTDYLTLTKMINFDKLHFFAFSKENITKENFEKEMLCFTETLITEKDKNIKFFFAFSAIITSALNAILLQLNTGFDLLLRPNYLAKNVSSILILIEKNIPELKNVLNGREKYNVLLGNYFYNKYSSERVSLGKILKSLDEENFFFRYLDKYSGVSNLKELLMAVDEYLIFLEKQNV